MEQQKPTSKDGTYEDDIQMVDVQADEIQNNELQSNNGDSIAVLSDEQTKTSDELKDLKICKLFVKWPKLCFGKWRAVLKAYYSIGDTIQSLSVSSQIQGILGQLFYMTLTLNASSVTKTF